MYNTFVQVILNNNSKSTDQIYTYGVGDALVGLIEEGKRVSINFGRGKNIIDALIVSVVSTCDYPLEKIKPVIEILDEKPIVTKEMIKMIFWIRERYICKYSDAMRLFIPAETQSAFEKHVCLKEDKEITEYNINKTPNQLKVIEYLKKHQSVSITQLTDKLNISRAVINNLVKKDILQEKLVVDNLEQKEFQLTEPLCLNEEQKNACETILNSDKKAFLLHGVTGSGKTEVYMNIIEEYLKMNKQSIMLVPEISLTAQTIDRFEKRFGNKIAVFHSKLGRKEKYIPKGCGGEGKSSFAFTEPGTGSDPKQLTTIATRAGDYYVINGVKRFITNAGYEGPMVIFCKDSDTGGCSAYILDKFSEGYSLSKPWEKIGGHGSPIFDVYLKDVKVPAGNLLGEPGKGFAILLLGIAMGKVGTSTIALGGMLAAYEEALKYAKEKLHRGSPIAKFQAIQLKVAHIAAKYQSTRWMCYRLGILATDIKDAAQFQAEAALLKGYASDTAVEVAKLAMDVHASYGLTTDYPVERIYRDAIIAPQIEGVSDMQRIIFAASVLN